MRYAIYGAGSLGTVLGAYIARTGTPIDLINRNKAHVKALKEQGAVITGTVQMKVPVTALLPEEMTGRYDIILLMTKQLQNRETVAFLNPRRVDRKNVGKVHNGVVERCGKAKHIHSWYLYAFGLHCLRGEDKEGCHGEQFVEMMFH